MALEMFIWPYLLNVVAFVRSSLRLRYARCETG